MNPSLQKLYDEIEGQRQRTIDSVRQLSHDHLNLCLKEGKWSVAQILSHLIVAEQLSLRYMQKKILGIDQLDNSGLLEEVKMSILKISQRLPGLKFKAPKGVIENTQHYDNLETIAMEWNKVRADLKLLLEKIPDHQLNRKIYKHAIAGYLNVKHSLIFLREHLIHHTPQIKKLVNVK